MAETDVDAAPACPARRAHDKRGAILAAARQLFPRHGFDKTSMDTIAERAMVSKATVYAHFASKEVLFRTTLEALAHASPNRWDALLEMQAPLEQRLAAVAKAVLRISTSGALDDTAYGLVRPPLLPSQMREEMWTLAFERYDNMMRALLAREVERSSLVIDNLPDASVHFFELMTALPANTAMRGDGVDADSVQQNRDVRGAVALFLRAYRPDVARTAGTTRREVPSGF
ncbi:TetR/AcrR family transcriptional regulator [Xanthomonas hortorum]|uniref:TetR/AcrR family transcriptional regulator n=1 Tax=Xanthomonas hortorum pv. pelargonii TaxID=453602 RepID=A0A6V7DV22_9XANT|nr:TetR/AcrR family transcriptional regulator [Xanthomonas hortorum]MCE4356569.1 TetR/AcrR family transcriptional regulator [Xanthomonas hortorum pv. pelargonii]MCM5526604.1 TetR/AcrR family transcriptional regulator [Xanthomonas hortorum pv. pelargonii]MCM5538453.1 TetR/AcrR family transcriptional regulator [Xanthomonas hortorum pv. pelargonii]MCM5542683.1 TetR/AcrR family transcriptional regulator [Xanthomonas hortorum pv. pelargonii]MCM5546612.1 TetR/AcrR family transcriptional regulator [X